MILADKIIRLRKKNGWSQEELAEKIHVSRQAVYKWEAAQSTPDLERILQLSNLFDVTTDYLLKDEMEEEEATGHFVDSPLKKVSLPEANTYLDWRKTASGRIALATLLCILSPIVLLVLSAAAELTDLAISQNAAGGIGVIVLLVMVAAAVAIYVYVGMENKPYEYLEEEAFETEYGVAGMVTERQKAFRRTYARGNILGVCLCILSPVPLLLAAFMELEFLTVVMLAITLALVGVGVVLFIVVGVQWASMQRLLKEGEFAEKSKSKSVVREGIETIYWLLATAIYLFWSFATNDWHITWLVWPVAGVLFAGVEVLCDLLIGKKKD